MIFHSTQVEGAFVVDVEPKDDERGSFARTFDATEFAAHGLCDRFDQQSLAVNASAGTVRGLHYQAVPHAEAKLVRCTRGAMFDVAVDTRRESGTYGKWVGLRLDAESRRALYIPAGCAHGYQTLEAVTEALYLIGAPYVAGAARGIHYADPDLSIPWPLPVACISQRDAGLPTLRQI